MSERPREEEWCEGCCYWTLRMGKQTCAFASEETCNWRPPEERIDEEGKALKAFRYWNADTTHKWWLIGELVLENDVYVDEYGGHLQVEVLRRAGDKRGEGFLLITLLAEDWKEGEQIDAVMYNEASKRFVLLPD